MGILHLLFVSALATASPLDLNPKIQTFVEHSLPRLACNLSVGAPGSVIASPENQDPNYYFHWIRDSAMIVNGLSRLLPHVAGTQNEVRLRSFIRDFSVFSEKLQNSNSPYGLGETRYLIDGSVDTSVWPRPQYDGIALRADALMDYLTRNGQTVDAPTRLQMEGVIRRDLDGIAQLFNHSGFDIWEYANGFHLFTRMVQLGALLRAQVYFGATANPTWSTTAATLTALLPNHLNKQTGMLTYDWSSGSVTDSHGQIIPDDGTFPDTSVALAVIHGNLPPGPFDDLDGRIWHSLAVQEDYARKAFPFNVNRQLGPGIGRDPGDNYYGGNAFYFITAAYAEHSFRLAKIFGSREGVLIADQDHQPTLSHVLPAPVSMGVRIRLPSRSLADAFTEEGEAFLETMLGTIPADGSMNEQFSKQDGTPTSARDLSWSYVSLMTAILEREGLLGPAIDFSKLDFMCPTGAKKFASSKY